MTGPARTSEEDTTTEAPERTPASGHARFTVFVLTLLAGYFALRPLLTGAGPIEVAFGIAIAVEATIANVWLWMADTRPNFYTTRVARALGASVWVLAAALVIGWIIRAITS